MLWEYFKAIILLFQQRRVTLPQPSSASESSAPPVPSPVSSAPALDQVQEPGEIEDAELLEETRKN